MSDWFHSLFGFSERSAGDVQAKLELHGTQLRSLVNDKRYECGILETPTLSELRKRYRETPSIAGLVQLSEWVGDVRQRLIDPASADATFQVASQFNLLEMIGPHVSPEQGITIYENDRTQGPACAIACGAGTVYRNYFVDLSSGRGQTQERQIDCLADFGATVGNTKQRFWRMQNGYLLTNRDSMMDLNSHLAELNSEQLDELRGTVRIGIQRHTQVTANDCQHCVTQVYASAVPVSYNPVSTELFEPLSRLVLEAAYEATLLAALTDQVNRHRPIYLTLLGGGAFGNELSWIVDAIERSLRLFADQTLSICFVSYGRSMHDVQALIQRHKSS